jgi:hypothetical protein
MIERKLVVMPQAWAETSRWFDWPSEVYAGRALAFGLGKVKLEGLPRTLIPREVKDD